MKKYLTIRLEVEAEELELLARGWEKKRNYKYGDDIEHLLADFILSDNLEYECLYDIIEVELGSY